MEYMFPELNTIGSSFEPTSFRYHLWVQLKDGERIRSQYLANALARIKSDTEWFEGWLISNSPVLNGEDIKSVGLGSVEYIPEVESVFLVQEHTVHVDKLPTPE
jgi:hypothetical protein